MAKTPRWWTCSLQATPAVCSGTNIWQCSICSIHRYRLLQCVYLSGKVNSANEAAEGVQACVKFSTDHFYDGIDRHVAGEREWNRTATGLVTFCVEKVECFLRVSSGHNPTNTSQQVAGEYLAHNVSCRRPRMTLTRQDESPVVKEQHQIGRCHHKYSLVCRYESRQDPAHHIRRKCLEKINNSVWVHF